MLKNPSSVLLLFLALACHSAFADSIAVPTNLMGVPAGDLTYQGKPVDRDEVVDLSDKGIDISTLDPVANDFWGPAPLPISDEGSWGFPADGTSFTFDGVRAEVTGVGVFARISAGGHTFQLAGSIETHAILMRVALLRKLGFSVATPKLYKTLPLKFVDLDTRDNFINSLVRKTGVNEEEWVVSKSKDTPDLVLKDLLVEALQLKKLPAHWGLVSTANIAGQRALRSIIAPLALLEFPESINQIGWELGKVISDSVTLVAMKAGEFQGETSISDLRWISRKIGALTRADWQQIVTTAGYPADIAAVVLEKLVARRNQLVDMTSVGSKKLPYDPKLTIGAVKEGKLTQTHYDGHNERFAIGDPQSPLRLAEIGRFGLLQGIASGLGKLFDKVNDHLSLQSVGDLAEKRQQEIINQLIDHFRNNPGAPLSMPVSTWGGPIGSVNVTASRNVVTGTYYGTNSNDPRVQLVDSVAVQAQIGYFLGIDGIPKITPGFTGNLVLQRNYIHVRPVADLSTALKTDWKAIFVPNFMKKLGALLDDGSGDASKGIDEFFKEFKQNEMFVISDSIIVGGKAQVSIPIAGLLGAGVIGLNPSITLSAGAQAAVIQRTTLVRTEDGDNPIQIYLQAVDSRAFDVGFDFNWWIKIFSFDHSNKSGEAFTKAFLLNKDDTVSDKQKDLALSLSVLFNHNSSSVLETKFKAYTLEHELDASINQAKLLRWKWYGLEEAHQVKIRPPADPDHNVKPEDFERTLISQRIEKINGTDDQAFLSDVVDAFTKGVIKVPGSGGGENPSNSLGGKAKWTNVSTEAEITPGRESNPVTVVEHHWGGWSLAKKDLFKVLDGIQSKVTPLNLDMPLIHYDAFNDMGSLQLYDIMWTLVVYQDGMSKIKSSLVTDSDGVMKAYEALVAIEGRDDFIKWCKTAPKLPFEYSDDDIWKAFTSYREEENGKNVDILCLKPWMKDVLKMRKEFRDDVAKADKADAPAKNSQWINRMIFKLDKEVDIAKLITWLGKDNCFFQIKIQGFRTKDEAMQNNSEGGTDIVDQPVYYSDSIGTANNKEGSGIFREFASKYGFMSHELYARYLTGGF